MHLVVYFTGSERGEKLVAWFGQFRLLSKLVRGVLDVHKTLLQYRDNRGLILQCLLISCLWYVLMSLQITWVLKAFPMVEVTWTTQIVTFCAVSLLASLPISLNGYGVQEGGYVFFFLSLGFSLSQAVILALAIRGLYIFVAIIGGLVFAVGNFSRVDIVTPPQSEESNKILTSGTVAS